MEFYLREVFEEISYSISKILHRVPFIILKKSESEDIAQILNFKHLIKDFYFDGNDNIFQIVDFVDDIDCVSIPCFANYIFLICISSYGWTVSLRGMGCYYTKLDRVDDEEMEQNYNLVDLHGSAK